MSTISPDSPVYVMPAIPITMTVLGFAYLATAILLASGGLH